MAIPSAQKMMLPTLKIVSDEQVHFSGDIIDELAKYFNLTNEEINELRPDRSQTILYNRGHWAITFLRKAVIIKTEERGYAQITKRGLDVLKKNPVDISYKFLEQFPEYREFRNRTKKKKEIFEATEKVKESSEILESIPPRKVDEIISAAQKEPPDQEIDKKRDTAHDEIKYLLLKLGSDMGLSVWVARNDLNREFNGNKFSDIPNRVKQLPAHLSEKTKSIIELIDVLWLEEEEIIAAFEIEHTTSIYSGLLRMSDLVSVQPNITIKLYIVAPDERREKVISEINRPTFSNSNLETPLPKVCKFMPYSKLKEIDKEHGRSMKYIGQKGIDIIDEFAENCDID